MVLSAEWSQVEVIDLINDGNGLGFILVGGRSTGVVIKTLTPGGVAERDGRLQCGDHLLQIGEVNLRGFSSEQVATVLRQSGAQVRLVVARPAEPKAIEANTLPTHAPIVPTKHLSDPDELTRYLFEYSAKGKKRSKQEQEEEEENNESSPNGCLDEVSDNNDDKDDGEKINNRKSRNHLVNSASIGFTPLPDTELADLPLPPIPKELAASADHLRHHSIDFDIIPFSIVSPPCSITPTLLMDHSETVIVGTDHLTDIPHQNEDRYTHANSSFLPTSTSANSSPETETYHVTLRKNVYGLGITVAGYVCEEEDVSGVFVKSIIEGSAAVMNGGNIQINDRIVAVDGISLAGVSNHQAVEILRNTNIEVKLTLERFLRGRKFEHLQVALTELKGDNNHADDDDGNEQSSQPPSPSIATLSWLPSKSDADSIATDGDGMDYSDQLEQHRKQRSSPTSPLTPTISNGNILQKTSPIINNIPESKSILTNGNIGVNVSVHDNDLKQSEIEVKKDELADINEGFRPVTQTYVNDEKNMKIKQSLLHKLHQKSINSDDQIIQPMESISGNKKIPLLKTKDDVGTSVTTATTKDNQQRPEPMVAISSVESLKVAWKSEFPASEIIVVEINKLSGLGISLEGTVDVECGIEKRPHHYIRSILEDGPVGRQGILKPGDELLQVNEYKLQGLKHTEVVKILKELPSHVKLVCVRGSTAAPSIINTSQNPEAFETRSLLPGGHQSLQNLQNLLTIKAQSESSLYTSSTATLTDQLRSKSLENVSGLALWSSDVTFVEIEKTEQGFGFSILDYQDPLDPDGSVIVIRGLIPGGSAESTNSIFPGDRLVSVGEHNLQGLELDAAVVILKGMPQGLTRLGICRPLSTSDSNIETTNGEGDSTST